MKKSTRKILATVMVLSMAFITLVGCKNATSNGVSSSQASITQAAATQVPLQNSWEKYKNEPVTLQFYINGPWTWDKNYYGKNWISKKITEDTGVTFKFITDPDWSDNGLNVIIASGQYPDLMHLQSGKSAIPEMIENNVFYEFSDLKTTTGIDLAAKMTPEMRAADRMKFDTQKLYFLRIWDTAAPDKINDRYAVKSTAAIAIVQQLYEEAGSPEIKTSEDFLNLLRKVKAKHSDMDMVGTGENNPQGVPAIVDSFSRLAGSLDPKSYVVPGKVVYFYQSPQYLQVLKFANTLYNEKLIFSTDLTDKDDQLKANLFNGKVFSKWSLDYDLFDEYSTTIAKIKTGWNLMALPFFTIGNGSYTPSGEYGMGGWLFDGIAKSTKYPERAAAMLDYLSSETFQKLDIYGQEGVHYDMVDGYPKLQKWVADLAVNDPEKFKMDLGFNFFDGIFRDSYWANLDRVQRSSPIQQKAFEAANSKGYLSLTGLPESIIGYSFPVDSDEAKIGAAINEYIGPAVTQIMMGKPENVESSYAALMTKLGNMGLQKLVDYWTKQMTDYSGKYQTYLK